MRESVHHAARGQWKIAEEKMHVISQLRAWLREERGQSALEFALTAPVLLLIVTGITTFGIAMNNYLSLTEATNVGARQLAITRGQGSDPCSLAAATVAAAAPSLKNTGSSTTGFGFTFVIAGTTYTSNPPTCSSATLTQGAPVIVTVTYPCSLKVYGRNLAPTCYLTAQTTEVLQ